MLSARAACGSLERFQRMRTSMFSMSGKMRGSKQHVDDLDADERQQNAADAIDEHVATQDRPGADRTIFHALEGERNQRRNDEGVENDSRQNGAVRCGKVHYVQ